MKTTLLSITLILFVILTAQAVDNSCYFQFKTEYIAQAKSKEKKTDLISKIRGNWYKTDNKQWEYGIYDSISIIHNRIFTNENIRMKGELIELTVKEKVKGNKVIISFASEKDGNYFITMNGESRYLYTQQGYLTPTITAEADFTQFFRKDTAYLQGYIDGYSPQSGLKNSLVHIGNNLTGQDSPVVVNIHSDGSFDCKLSLSHPVENSFSLNHTEIPFYIEPGQTLSVYINWKAISNDMRAYYSDSPVKGIEYMGPSASLSQMYRSLKESINLSNELYNSTHTLTPDQFTKRMESISAKWNLTGDSLLQIYGASAKAIHLLKNKLAIKKGEIFLYFLLTREIFAQRDTSSNQILKIKANSSHFSFLRHIPLDDETMVADAECRRFINKFEYMTPLQIIQNENMEPVPTSQNTKTVTDNDIDKIILANNQKYLTKGDSLVYLLSGQFNTFFWQTSLVRRLQHVLKTYKTRNAAQKHVDILCQQLTYPVLIEESRRVLEAVFPDDTTKSYHLPECKATDIFRNIIKAHAGKVLFIDFWATSCGSCRLGIQETAELRRKYKNHPEFQFIYITDCSGSRSGYDSYVSKNLQGEASYLLDITEFNYLRELFKFIGIPHYELIEKDGSVAINSPSAWELKDYLEKRFGDYHTEE